MWKFLLSSFQSKDKIQAKKKRRDLSLNFFVKQSGVTLIELLVATGIASIVMLSVMSTIGNVYFAQKKLRFSQNFYSESRILMERISQFARNNTIDYDRYFLEVGPNPANCVSFDARQKPLAGSLPNTPVAIGKTNRASLVGGYSSIFYWDTTDVAGNGTQDRNLGGMNTAGNVDPCTQAFYGGAQPALYLINGARTLRTAILNKDDHDGSGTLAEQALDKAEDYRVEVQRQLGADIDGDLVADIWGPYDENGDGTYSVAGTNNDIEVVWDSANTVCEIHWDKNGNNVIEVTEEFPILGDETSEDFCAKAYDWTPISPKLMKIDNLTFQPAPDRDPFLNFRIDTAQVHPHVFISLTTNVREPNKFGYEVGEQPQMSFQTTVSSRVFGNTR